MAAKVLILLSYRHQKLATEANCLAVLPFSDVIPVKGHLIFSLSPFFKRKINMESFFLDMQFCCTVQFYGGGIKEPKILWFCLRPLFDLSLNRSSTSPVARPCQAQICCSVMSSGSVWRSAVIKGRVCGWVPELLKPAWHTVSGVSRTFQVVKPVKRSVGRTP